MSLRAKLEAVIYAAEEPVTLAQLAVLFSEEALTWKAEQEAAFRAMQVPASSEPVLTIGEGLAYLGLEQTPDFYNAAEATPETATVAEAHEAGSNGSAIEPGEGVVVAETEVAAILVPTSEAEAASPAQLELGGVPIASAAEPVDPESESKRLARLRDREVKAILRQILDELIASYAADERGVEIREIAGGFRMATKPECHDAVRVFIRSQKPPLKLSLPALETLAVIAYKQPVTAPEVNEIRGVESGGVLGSLLSRKLISTAGRKQVIGRPILYKTTKEFLLRFGLKDIAELPSMEEFEKMATIELSETSETPEAAAEAEGGLPPGSGPELDENAPEDETASEVQSVAAAETNAPELDAASSEAATEATEPEPGTTSIENAAETTATQAEAAHAGSTVETIAPELKATTAESATETTAPEVEASSAEDTPEAVAQTEAANAESTSETSAPESDAESVESAVETTTVEPEAAGADDSSTEPHASNEQEAETEPVAHD